jgi:1-acyl-sn-glycerol-3-phosphate acyltransferase
MRLQPLPDLAVTLLCWAWFTLGFICCFSWRYLAHGLLRRDPEPAFQRLNSQFYRVFFFLLRSLAPKQQWRIDPAIASIRGSVVLCNHLSYLDPILLITLWPRHRTIVKPRFFALPIFGWVLRKSGYVPASAEGPQGGLLLDRLSDMPAFLASGGNLFIFPEGSRSRDGKLGPLHPGALKIARHCRAPIVVLRLRNTHRLFPPGKFCFRSGTVNRIGLGIIDRIEPVASRQQPSRQELEHRIIQAYREHLP